jgi:hypothetical protein
METNQIARIQDQSQTNGDNRNNVRLEANRYFRNERKEFLKDKISEISTCSKHENMTDSYRGINKFKKILPTLQEERKW